MSDRHWNYRVTRQVVEEETVFTIREVYYKGDDVEMWSAEPDPVQGESVEDLAAQLEQMQRALTEPVLDLSPWENDR